MSSLARRLGARWLTAAAAGGVTAAILGTISVNRSADVRLASTLSLEAQALADRWVDGAPIHEIAGAVVGATGHRVVFVPVATPGREPVRGPRNTGREPGPATIERGSGGELTAVVSSRAGLVRVSADRTAARRGAGRYGVLWSVLAGTIVAGVLGTVAARRLTRPLADVRTAALVMAGGAPPPLPLLIPDDEVGELAGALRSIHDQLDTRQRALGEEQRLLTAVAASTSEGLLAVDARRRIVWMNEPARELLGVTAPLPCAMDQLPRLAALRDAIAAAAAARPIPSAEIEVGGRVLACSARPLGRGGAVLALFDLSDVRRLESMRRDFVANVSHELQTPLTAIRGFAETLLDDVPPDLRRQFASTIHANAVRMQRLVEELLDLARIESGTWVPRPAWVSLAPAAADAFAVVRKKTADGALTFTVVDGADGADGAAVVYADSTALRQVLTNLVGNAVRHTPPGGQVAVAGRAVDGGVEVSVRDTGAGIAAEHLPRIFERFYRADPGRAREAGGTGLGLAIVKHLVEAHGGRVWVESERGRGTTVHVFFPNPRD